ncbi:MAG: hypothetical protein NTV56_02055 [Alphaproteobacteria bacterium]|nr:hypothetical protein [Alphaproteobacteria bacterium]
MKPRTVWLSAIGGIVALLIGLPILLSVIERAREGEIDNYRTMTEITLADGDRTVSGKVYSDCISTRRSNWNTGTQIGTIRRGSNPFVVLTDRSILILTELNLCPSIGAASGEVYTFDPAVPSNRVVDRRIAVPYAHALRYDNVDDVRTMTSYRQQQLFGAGIDGLRVVEAKLTVTERNAATPLPDTYSDAFPWYRNTPRAAVGSQDYTLHDPKSRFSGFVVSLDQLVEKQRCDKFDREAEGPVLVTTDRWDSCLPWGGSDMGWLVAHPNTDLSQIDYSYGDRSSDKIGTRYRATWLQERGVKGAVEGEGYFYWRPVICIDARCFATHPARQSTWEGFRLYYPKKNHVLTVEWKN